MQKKSYFGKLGELKKIKEKNGAIIAICGCMMQEAHIQQKLKQSYPFVDIIFGTHTLHKLPEDLYNKLISEKKINDILDIDGKVYEGLPIKRNDLKKASVTIMYGCNNFCSYCIVPYVRGRERSRKVEDILKEIEELAKEGYKEITLLGQNVNSYMKSETKGKSKEGKIDTFAKLLYEVNKIKECNKVSRLVHLPLQSGSTRILKKMNRKYTKEDYLALVQKMRKELPNVLFSTDIIVGFPEETEEDFEETLDVVEKVNFEQIFMFIYSRRVGTVADKNPNQVPEEVKHKRFDRLKELFESQIEENNKKYIGTIHKVLVEGLSKNNDNMLTSRTNTNKVIVFEGDKDLIGKTINVEIVSEHKWYLKGKVVEGVER